MAFCKKIFFFFLEFDTIYLNMIVSTFILKVGIEIVMESDQASLSGTLK